MACAVRQFKLINSLGEEFDLMRKDAFLYMPSGLGMAMNYTSEAVGYDFIETSVEMAQKIIAASMNFEGYQQYQEFVRFCAKSPLKLAYMPLKKWYYIDCQLSRIDKSELEQGSQRLIPAVDFLCFSTWYESVTVTKTQINPQTGKRYNYQYPYIYAETAVGNADINITGDLPSYCRLNIMGPVENPSWVLLQSGKVLLRGRVLASIPDGHKLVVDSAPAQLEIAEYTTNNEFVQNLYQASDFSTARFITLPVGKSVLTFSHDGISVIDALLEVEQLAATV